MSLAPLIGDELATARDKWDWVWTFKPSSSLQVKRLRLVSDALNGHATEAVPAIRSGWTPYLRYADQRFATTPSIRAEMRRWRQIGNNETRRRLLDLIAPWHSTGETPTNGDRAILSKYRKFGFDAVCSEVCDSLDLPDVPLPKGCRRHSRKKGGFAVTYATARGSRYYRKLATESLDDFIARLTLDIQNNPL